MTDSLTTRQFERLATEALPAIRDHITRRYKDAFLADAVAADSLSAAWAHHLADPTFFDSTDPAVWMGRRANWRALDDLRRRNKTAALVEEHQGDGPEEPARAPDAPAVAPDGAALEALQAFVFDALRSLAAEDRFLLEGMSYDSLTDQALGLAIYGDSDGSPQARGLRVFRRRQKALGRLRDALLERGFDEKAWLAV